MNISSRTPDGFPCRCPVCGTRFAAELSVGFYDVSCPSCGYLVVSELKRALDALGSEVSHQTPMPIAGEAFTDRERAILEVTIEGASASVIAERLGVSVAMAETLLARVKRKIARGTTG